MRHFTLLPALGLAALLAPAGPDALAAFDGDFYIVDGLTPPAVYTFDSAVATLGAWSVGFFPSEFGESFIDTRPAPDCVILGSSTGVGEDFAESETLMFIELPEDGFVSFAVEVNNIGTEAYAAAFEIYLAGEALYFFTEPGARTYHLGFDVLGGQTLEFRSYSLSSGAGAFAANASTLAQFSFEPSAIPEPASAAALAGLAILGGVGVRRRRPERP